ncbi:uncharacterized protein EDB91DRAFT_1256598 [Suillus paluster]|uniref:uncharacterized protein n=1 Tax=Suillus paluster TaxID=48578 RepID=UPI001B874550|nr:uncharacterized protein EDB91DRAFT_1256598 [Suillus paluster]KAG1721243.1 hypothetical protein EDB91DRAFT_1256598 [Suillus paluster]
MLPPNPQLPRPPHRNSKRTSGGQGTPSSSSHVSTSTSSQNNRYFTYSWDADCILSSSTQTSCPSFADVRQDITYDDPWSRRNISSETQLVSIHPDRGYTGRHGAQVYRPSPPASCFNFKSWQWLEDTLHHAFTALSANIILPFSFAILPYPSQYGYLRDHKTHRHALQLCKDFKTGLSLPPRSSQPVLRSGFYGGVTLHQRMQKRPRLRRQTYCFNMGLAMLTFVTSSVHYSRRSSGVASASFSTHPTVKWAFYTPGSIVYKSRSGSYKRRLQKTNSYASEQQSTRLTLKQFRPSHLTPIPTLWIEWTALVEPMSESDFKMLQSSSYPRGEMELGFSFDAKTEFETRPKEQFVYNKISNEWDICSLSECDVDALDGDPGFKFDKPNTNNSGVSDVTIAHSEIKTPPTLPSDHNEVGRSILYNREISQDILFTSSLEDVLSSRYRLDAQFSEIYTIRKYLMEMNLPLTQPKNEFTIRYFISCFLLDITPPSILWDLHPKNIDELVESNVHFNAVSVIQGIRERWGPSLEDIILSLFERGINFTLVFNAQVVHPSFARPRTIFESILRPAWVVARTNTSGILWRLCKQELASDIPNGPSKDVQFFADTSPDAPKRYLSDTLS